MSVFRRRQPHWCLSPMDGVTDAPMRQITKKYGHVDLLTTEFVNVEGWHYAPAHLQAALSLSAQEQPVLLQLYGLNPDYFAAASRQGLRLGFRGIDLNFGCPAASVVNNGAGAGLIAQPDLAGKIFQAVRAVISAQPTTSVGKRPTISIKTRLGVSEPRVFEWFSFLLSLKPDLITVHGRTLKQGYGGQADWQAIAQVVALRNQLSPETAIFGNGDVKSLSQARILVKQTGVDGVVIGRAALGNPWVFTGEKPSLKKRLHTALEHARLYEHTFSRQAKYKFSPMRKHLAAYLRGFVGTKALRSLIVQTNSSSEVAWHFANFLSEL